MANEISYASILTASLVGNIYEASLMHLRAEAVMASTVRVFNDKQGLSPRVGRKYPGGVFQTIAETADGTANAWTPTPLSTLTPAQYYRMFFVTDARVASDPVAEIMADAAMELGVSAGETVNNSLLAQLSSFTGGTVGAAGTTIAWSYFWAMRTILQAAKVRPPYFFPVHPYNWHTLASTADTAGVAVVQASLPQDMVRTSFTIRQVDDVYIIVAPDISIDGNDDSYCGMYGRDALALDIRRPYRLRTQRDESRGAGGDELVATLLYAAGVYDPTQGVTGIFDTQAPS